MCDESKLAFELAAKWSELLITLATGLIALSITFTKEILPKVSRSAFVLLVVAWILLGVSVYYGFGHHGSLIGDLAFNDDIAKLRSDAAAMSPPQCYAVKPSDLATAEGKRQWFSFFGGTFIFVLYGIIGFYSRATAPSTPGAATAVPPATV